jgi:hypothetical protein
MKNNTPPVFERLVSQAQAICGSQPPIDVLRAAARAGASRGERESARRLMDLMAPWAKTFGTAAVSQALGVTRHWIDAARR